MVMIAPSLLAADFGNLRQEVERLETSGSDMLHWDVMDGHFVPNLTFGVPVIEAMRGASRLPFDVHLMVEKPEKMLGWFAKAGADYITVHAEAVADLRQTIEQIHALGVKAGVALKPQTKPEVLREVLAMVDLVLVMTVEPGFGGQKFMREMLPKIGLLKEMKGDKRLILSVDGGINRQTAPDAASAGADMLVAGTAVFTGANIRENINFLR